MRMQVLQHVPFEDAANIGVWAEQNGYEISVTKLYETTNFPDIGGVDWLVIMGGPMNIYEDDQYRWLIAEKTYIKQAIEAGKRVLGICLGAQLIADVLGGKVTANREKEIGWFPCQLIETGREDSLLSRLPDEFMAFHWHGDTFSIPPGAVHLARSEVCENQAFQYGDRVLGLQFHLDYSVESIAKMINNCQEELVGSPYIQSDQAILLDDAYVSRLWTFLDIVLAALASVE